MKLSTILEEIEVRPAAYILLGPPKSGKTDWAKKKIKKNISIVNLNINNFKDIEIRSSILEDCLNKGKSFIYEGVALKDYRIEKLINKIKSKKYIIYLVKFDKKINEDYKVDKKLIKKIDFIYNQFKDKFDNIIEVNNG